MNEYIQYEGTEFILRADINGLTIKQNIDKGREEFLSWDEISSLMHRS